MEENTEVLLNRCCLQFFHPAMFHNKNDQGKKINEVNKTQSLQAVCGGGGMGTTVAWACSWEQLLVSVFVP